MRILAIDPGNDRTGYAIFFNGSLVEHGWFDPWQDSREGTYRHKYDRVYIEVPQNGTHASRGGVHFAAGMALRSLCPYQGNPRRSDVRRVTPTEWRKGLGLATRGVDKQYYVNAANDRLGRAPSIVDHNEAEACLIGLYAVSIEEGK